MKSIAYATAPASSRKTRISSVRPNRLGDPPTSSLARLCRPCGLVAGSPARRLRTNSPRLRTIGSRRGSVGGVATTYVPASGSGAERTNDRSQPRSSSKSSRSVGSCRSNDSTTGLSGPHSSAKAGGSAHTSCTSSAVASSGYGACPCTARKSSAPSAHRSVAGPIGAANCQFSCTGTACSGAHRSVTGPTTVIRTCRARSAASAVAGPRRTGAPTAAARSSQRAGG